MRGSQRAVMGDGSVSLVANEDETILVVDDDGAGDESDVENGLLAIALLDVIVA